MRRNSPMMKLVSVRWETPSVFWHAAQHAYALLSCAVMSYVA